MKYIVIVTDGMEDLPLEELGNRTPLETANSTNMDFMAKHGSIGIVHTIPEGLDPGSDVGNISVLGYNPKECFSGRAPLEAASMGIDLADNEIAFRCNLVTVSDNIMSDYSSGHIKSEESAELIKALNEKLSSNNIRFYAGKSYRHLLILNGMDPEKFKQIKTTPPHDIMGKEIKNYLPEGRGSKLLLKLMEQSKNILENHHINNVRLDLGENPGNMIWLWGQGTKPNIQNFKEKFDIKGGIISAVDLVNGIGKFAGLENIKVPGITGYYDTNYLGKAEYALESLKKNDFVFVHIEAPDEAGHNGDTKEKVRAIENIDKHIIGTILNHFNKHDDFRILVLSDHPTPVSLRTHSSEPVSFIMYGSGIANNNDQVFNEHTARDTDLVFNSGEEIIDFFIKRNIQ